MARRKVEVPQVVVYCQRCTYCGKEFLTNKRNAKTCSENCQKLMRRNITEKYYQKKKEKRMQLRIAWSQPRECLQCGNVFVPQYSRQICCSTVCQRIRHVEQVKVINAKKREMRAKRKTPKVNQEQHELLCSNLSSDNAKARAAGMSYGYYKNFVREQEEKIKVG